MPLRQRTTHLQENACQSILEKTPLLQIVGPGEGAASRSRLPIKVLPGFPVACSVKKAPKTLMNESGPLPGQKLKLQLLDAHGMPATMPNVGEDLPWSFRRPTLQLTADGQCLLEVSPEGQQLEEAWFFEPKESLLTLMLNMTRAEVKLATWAHHRTFIPCDLKIELYEAVPQSQQEREWKRLTTQLVLEENEIVKSAALPPHTYPTKPILLQPSTRPATVHVVVGKQSNAELVSGSGEDPLRRWQLRCDAGKTVNCLFIQV